MTETDLSPLSALLQDRAATAWSEVRPFAEPATRGGWTDASPTRRPSEAVLPDRAPRDVR